jgi:transposase
MNVTTIGLDLAKNVFQIHGVNERGAGAVRKQLKRHQVLPFFARLAGVNYLVRAYCFI